MIKLGKRTFGNFWKTYWDKLTDVLAFILVVLVIIGIGVIYILAIAGWIFHWWLSVIGIILAIVLTPFIMMLQEEE